MIIHTGFEFGYMVGGDGGSVTPTIENVDPIASKSAKLFV